MRSHLENTWPDYATLFFCSLWWSYDADDWKFPIPTGTANTVAELKEQIPLDQYFHDLPEVGPFHWEGPHDAWTTFLEDYPFTRNHYTIKGKTDNPELLAKWISPTGEDFSDDFETKKEVTLVTGWVTTGHGIELYSNGSFNFYSYELIWSEED